MQSVTSNAVAKEINSLVLVENYYTLVNSTLIPASYTTITLQLSRKFSDYDFIDFYVGLLSDNIYYPRGFMRIPSLLFKPTSENKIYRVDIPCVGSNNINVSFRYKSDTQVDVCLFNSSSAFYAKILGEIITH